MLDSEIKAPFLLNKHGDSTFYFINSMRTITAITEKKNLAEIMATFLANEINATDRDATGSPEQVQIIKPCFLEHI